MVLPNLYFFARGAADLSYLDTPDEQVLGDLADLLGGPQDLLVPAWRCMTLPLEGLPADLAVRLRKAVLSGEAARFIPGRAAAVSRYPCGRSGEPPRVFAGDRQACRYLSRRRRESGRRHAGPRGLVAGTRLRERW